MVGLAEAAVQEWRDGDTLDVHAEMARLTLAVVARTLFGTDLPAEESRAVTGALSGTLAQFDRVFSPLLPLTERLPLPATRRFRAAHDTFDRIVYGSIERRRAEGASGDDLLSMLLRAQDAGARMTDTQVRDEAVTLFLAGHETTSNALTWTWYLLAAHPNARTAWLAELDAVLDDRAPTADDLPSLRLTDAVLHESIRLFPPAWAIGRTATEPVEAGGTPIDPGTTVVVSPWLLHHDPRWFPDPSAFRPDRWPAGPEPRHAYVPFGAGPRVCIGEPFAWMEAALLLAAIGRRWSLDAVPGHRVELQPVITLRPRNEMPMVARARGGEQPEVGAALGEGLSHLVGDAGHELVAVVRVHDHRHRVVEPGERGGAAGHAEQLVREAEARPDQRQVVEADRFREPGPVLLDQGQHQQGPEDHVEDPDRGGDEQHLERLAHEDHHPHVHPLCPTQRLCEVGLPLEVAHAAGDPDDEEGGAERGEQADRDAEPHARVVANICQYSFAKKVTSAKKSSSGTARTMRISDARSWVTNRPPAHRTIEKTP